MICCGYLIHEARLRVRHKAILNANSGVEWVRALQHRYLKLDVSPNHTRSHVGNERVLRLCGRAPVNFETIDSTSFPHYNNNRGWLLDNTRHRSNPVCLWDWGHGSVG